MLLFQRMHLRISFDRFLPPRQASPIQTVSYYIRTNTWIVFLCALIYLLLSPLVTPLFHQIIRYNFFIRVHADFIDVHHFFNDATLAAADCAVPAVDCAVWAIMIYKDLILTQ